MMTKYIDITFSNGEVWRVSAMIVAQARAAYYARLDVNRGDKEDYPSAYQEEYEYTLQDNAELLDWVKNNTHWNDLKTFATKVLPRPEYDYTKGFERAEITITEILE